MWRIIYKWWKWVGFLLVSHWECVVLQFLCRWRRICNFLRPMRSQPELQEKIYQILLLNRKPTKHWPSFTIKIHYLLCYIGGPSKKFKVRRRDSYLGQDLSMHDIKSPIHLVTQSLSRILKKNPQVRIRNWYFWGVCGRGEIKNLTR